jgi:hypothetical protein
MNFELDSFEDDIKTTEEILNDHNNARPEIQETNQRDGDAGLRSNNQSEIKEFSQEDKTQKLGLFRGVPNALYHSGPGESSSSIKPALKSLNLYNETKSGRVPFNETPAMRLGTATHKLILEAYDFASEIAISKKFGTGKAAKAEKAEFYAEHEGKTIITADDYENCKYMRDSLLNLSEVREIFETGEAEVSGYYVDRDRYSAGSNMLCKFRPDWENSWCIADVKSTIDASEQAFSRTIHALHYNVSAAHYLEGSRILTGQEHDQFLFLCVEPNPPYEAAVYKLGPESLEAGLMQRRYALDAIKRGRETKEWPLLNNGVARVIEMPSYALNDLRLSKI